MRGHAVQLLLCPKLSRDQWMLQCLSGDCSSQSSTGQPICVPVMGCQCQLCFLTLYRAQNLQSKEKTGPSFHRVYLICVFLLLSHYSQCHQLPCYFRDGWGAVQSPSHPLKQGEVWAFPLCPPTSTFLEALLKLMSSTSPKSTSHETKDLTCF